MSIGTDIPSDCPVDLLRQRPNAFLTLLKNNYYNEKAGSDAFLSMGFEIADAVAGATARKGGTDFLQFTLPASYPELWLLPGLRRFDMICLSSETPC
jgi:hypothetical protein